MVLPIETARQAMDFLMNHSSITEDHLRRTTYVAGILQSTSSDARVVLLAAAGENARGFTQALMDEMQNHLNPSGVLNTVVQGWVNTVEGGRTEFAPEFRRAAGNDAEQQLLRVRDFGRSLAHEHNTEESGLQLDEELLSDRLSDRDYTSETGDDIPSLTYNRRTVITESESEWVSPLSALKTSREFCPSCTEAVESEGLRINPDDRTEAER